MIDKDANSIRAPPASYMAFTTSIAQTLINHLLKVALFVTKGREVVLCKSGQVDVRDLHKPLHPANISTSIDGTCDDTGTLVRIMSHTIRHMSRLSGRTVQVKLLW